MSGQIEIFLPPAGHGAGVLVAHPWWGLNDSVRIYAARLAAAGFVVGALDMFDAEMTTDPGVAETLIRKHWDTAPGRLRAALGALAAHPAVEGRRLGAVGFSFGAYQLLGSLDDARLGALVTYYADREVHLGRMPLLGHFAETDSFADDQPGMIRKIAAAGSPSAAHVYSGTVHWFAEPDRPEYAPEAADLAMARSVAFLAAALRPA